MRPDSISNFVQESFAKGEDCNQRRISLSESPHFIRARPLKLELGRTLSRSGAAQPSQLDKQVRVKCDNRFVIELTGLPCPAPASNSSQVEDLKLFYRRQT